MSKTPVYHTHLHMHWCSGHLFSAATLITTNADTPTHVRLWNGAAIMLPWKLLQIILSLERALYRLLFAARLPAVLTNLVARRLLAQENNPNLRQFMTRSRLRCHTSII